MNISLKKSKLYIMFALIATVTLLITGTLTSCGTSDAAKGSLANPVKFGVVGESDDQWHILKEDLQNEGIYIEYSNFTEYNVGLQALEEGSLDINQSVHVLLLANYNVNNSTSLKAIGSKAVFSLGLYPNMSKDISSVDDFNEGDVIVIPNDPSNNARALLELQDAGLVELRNGGSPLSTMADVLPSSKVTVKDVDADIIPTLLTDPGVVAGITTNDHIRAVGISPSSSLLHLNLAGDTAKYYTNIFAVRPADVDNELYNRIVDIALHDERYLDEVLKESGNTATLTTDITKDQLATIQTDLEAQLREK